MCVEEVAKSRAVHTPVLPWSVIVDRQARRALQLFGLCLGLGRGEPRLELLNAVADAHAHVAATVWRDATIQDEISFTAGDNSNSASKLYPCQPGQWRAVGSASQGTEVEPIDAELTNS